MMVSNCGKRSEQLIFRKGWGVFVFTVLVFSGLATLVDVQPIEGGYETYSEDFTTTNYVDSFNTNVSGWGSGTINLPLKTELASSYDTPGEANDVFVEGDYAYVACGGSGLQIVDVGDPANPTNASSYNTPGESWDVFISGDYAYVACGGSGLQIVDISNATKPTNVSAYDTPGQARGVFVEGDYAYIADSLSGLQVVNISDPANPTNASAYNIGETNDVFISGNYAYLAGWNSLQIVDISDPTNPTNASTYSAIGNTWEVFVKGDYAYVANDDFGLRVFDVSDPTNPTSVSFYDTEGNAKGVFVSGDYAYVVSEGSYGLQLVNVSDPTNLSYAGSYNISGYDHGGVFVEGDYAYVACEESGLDIVEVITNQYMPIAFANSIMVAYVDYPNAISRATLTVSDSVPFATEILYYLSADGGSNWEYVTPDSEHSFRLTGYELLWRAHLISSNWSRTPTISSLSIEYYTEDDGFELSLTIIGIIIVAVVGIVATILLYRQKKEKTEKF